MDPVEPLVVKLVLNILFKVLRIGGQGCASRIPQVEMMMMMIIRIMILVLIMWTGLLPCNDDDDDDSDNGVADDEFVHSYFNSHSTHLDISRGSPPISTNHASSTPSRKK